MKDSRGLQKEENYDVLGRKESIVISSEAINQISQSFEKVVSLYEKQFNRPPLINELEVKEGMQQERVQLNKVFFNCT